MSRLLRAITNRNPINLEKTCLARKPVGYHFEKDAALRQFYYQLEFEKTGQHTWAFVRHMKRGRVLTASTSQFAIASRLHSNTDVAAAFNIGRVLGRRCLQAGIHFVHRGIPNDEYERSERLRAFCGGVEEGGVRVGELPFLDQSYRAHTKYFTEQPSIDETEQFEAPK